VPYAIPVAAVAIAVGSVIGFLTLGGDDSEPAPASSPADTKRRAELPQEEVIVRAEPEQVPAPGEEPPPPPPREVELVPRDLSETSERVARTFERRIVPTGRRGLIKPKLQSVRCAAGSCVVKYRADGPGTGRVLESQGPLWHELFSNPRVHDATLIADVGGRDVHGLGLGRPGGTPPVVVRCDRKELSRIRRIGVGSAPDVKALCKVEAVDRVGN
jgi:hypothetical protein